jgi:hypothetical protein
MTHDKNRGTINVPSSWSHSCDIYIIGTQRPLRGFDVSGSAHRRRALCRHTAPPVPMKDLPDVTCIAFAGAVDDARSVRAASARSGLITVSIAKQPDLATSCKSRVASGASGSISGAILPLGGGGSTRLHLATLSLARRTSQIFEECVKCSMMSVYTLQSHRYDDGNWLGKLQACR